MTKLAFLKLGGSLITDKKQCYHPRLDVLTRISEEIAMALRDNPDQSILLGHGSGSFGHTAAKKHRTREGVRDADGWKGYAEVWHQASLLNRHVMDALRSAGLPAMAFPPSSSVVARAGTVERWDLLPVQTALKGGLVPVVYGDVVVDTVLGGTILSTEDLFAHLAGQLAPDRILLAGLEPGVWADFPRRSQLIDRITPDSFEGALAGIQAAEGQDVTGGMNSKVREMLELVQLHPGLQIAIFSGDEPGSVYKALTGPAAGTLVTQD